MRVCIVLFLFLISCGRKEDNSQSSESPSISPEGCSVYTEGGLAGGRGVHQFQDGRYLLVTAYYCGQNAQGQQCFTFFHSPDATEINTLTESACN